MKKAQHSSPAFQKVSEGSPMIRKELKIMIVTLSLIVVFLVIAIATGLFDM